MADTKCSGRSLHLIQEGILVDRGSTINAWRKGESHEVASPASLMAKPCNLMTSVNDAVV